MWFKKIKLRVLFVVCVCLVIYVGMRMLNIWSRGELHMSSAHVSKLNTAIAEHYRLQLTQDDGSNTEIGRSYNLPSGMMYIKTNPDNVTDSNNKKAMIGNASESDNLPNNSNRSEDVLGAIISGKLKTDLRNGTTATHKFANKTPDIKDDAEKLLSINHTTVLIETTKNALSRNVVAFSDKTQVYDMKFKAIILHDKKTCLFMKTEFGKAPVCIYNPKTDRASAALFVNASWQPSLISVIGNILKREQDIVYLDLGCNIGVFTILATILGKRVIAVDHDAENLQLLTEALRLSKRERNVTLIQNIISDVHASVTLITSKINRIEPTKTKSKSRQPVKTITLDDLVYPLTNITVFLRMDLGISEWKALLGGKKFFKNVRVKYLVMNWKSYRNHDDGKNIKTFLFERGLHAQSEDGAVLDQDNYESWPDNVIWQSR